MNEIASPDHNNKQGNFWLVMVVLIGTFLVSYCSSHQDLPKVFETPEAIPTVTTSRAPVVPVMTNSMKVETKLVSSNEGAVVEGSGIQVINIIPTHDPKLDRE